MSLFRKVWADAIAANQELALNRSNGEKTFQHLLEMYPSDGMVLYERGEAYEYLNELDKAEFDYQSAESLFPLKHWQVIAHEGLVRVQAKKQNPASRSELSKDSPSAIIHRIHTVPQLPHDIRVDAFSAIQKFASEPHFAAGQLRACLEQLIVSILDKRYIDYSDKRGLEQQLSLLKSLSLIPLEIANKMDIVRDLGNRGLHKRKTKRPVDFSPSMIAFAEIVEWYGKSRLR